ncbi:response regulator transcription factor [Streptomyces sp. L7]
MWPTTRPAWCARRCAGRTGSSAARCRRDRGDGQGRRGGRACRPAAEEHAPRCDPGWISTCPGQDRGGGHPADRRAAPGVAAGGAHHLRRRGVHPRRARRRRHAPTTKESGREDITRAVRAAAAGRSVLDPAVRDRLVAAAARAALLSNGRVRDSPRTSTPREVEVLTLIGEGLTNRGIAERLVVSEATVKTHINNPSPKLICGTGRMP